MERDIYASREISIHALREEGDGQERPSLDSHADFNPRPPRGGRPAPEHLRRNRRGISIHALREEGDKSLSPPLPLPNNFNPRPPRGGRRGIRLGYKATVKFQSTPSARRATGATPVLTPHG